MPKPVRIAMWSGPRTISTAMMRAFGSREDTVVTDEPLYAHYLRTTGLPHPGAAEVIAAGESDWRRVTAFLTGPVPGGKAVHYQKHMAHHLLPGVERDWLLGLTHAFLIRDPRSVIASLHRVTPDPTPADTGLPQLLDLLAWIEEATGAAPLVIDTRDVLEDPAGVLAALCEALGIPPDPGMLAWKPGIRETDGVWAPYWYESVANSTGFGPYRASHPELPAALDHTLAECQAAYSQLHTRRLTA